MITKNPEHQNLASELAAAQHAIEWRSRLIAGALADRTVLANYTIHRDADGGWTLSNGAYMVDSATCAELGGGIEAAGEIMAALELLEHASARLARAIEILAGRN